MTAERHIPVMASEALDALNIHDDGVYVDATFGAGGYTRRMLRAADCVVYAFDRDPRAIRDAEAWAGEFGDRLILVNRPFAEMEAALAEFGVSAVDGVVFDLGVSSMQLDEADRGFSFMRDGPLSMRMDGAKPDAADVIATAETSALAAVFKAYGEERHAGRIARAIVAARDEAPIAHTRQLAEIVEKATPYKPHRGRGDSGGAKIHPATRVFQALRIFVNDELGQLVEGLRAAERVLRPAGRLAVVTFHSLEDRIVKRFFASRSEARAGGSRHQPEAARPPASFRLLFSKAVVACASETGSNPRARSAKLRAGERLPTPASSQFDEETALPRLAALPDLKEGIA